MALIITLPKVLLFALIGFYSGKAYTQVASAAQSTEYAIFTLITLLVAFYVIYKKFSMYLSKRIENENSGSIL